MMKVINTGGFEILLWQQAQSGIVEHTWCAILLGGQYQNEVINLDCSAGIEDKIK